MYQYGATFVQNVRRVSQGTIFGPILFFIYTADICNGRVYFKIGITCGIFYRCLELNIIRLSEQYNSHCKMWSLALSSLWNEPDKTCVDKTCGAV